ncbi:MAG: hypothetical protein PHW77_03960 [Eubacteriales bacterium]|nr:hypothetical protein [Eubacteriales bacterium]
MKILNGIPGYAVYETNFEAARLALNFLGENYSASYFHGIAGTAFRIGGICPCAPTCTLSMNVTDLIKLFGYNYEEITYDDANKEGSLAKLVNAVRESIDGGVPALVWNAFTQCEWDLVTGYDENEKVFYGRGAYPMYSGDYGKNPWNKSLEQAGLTGLTAIIIKRGDGRLDKKAAEIAAVKEAVRHANDSENTDKLCGGKWVFLQGKAAYQRWADDFSKPEYKRGMGDAYCIGVYSSCHAQAGLFLSGIAPDYPEASALLTEAAELFDKEAEKLGKLKPLLDWNSPETDVKRNESAAVLLREAAEYYATAIDLLSTAADTIQTK